MWNLMKPTVTVRFLWPPVLLLFNLWPVWGIYIARHSRRSAGDAEKALVRSAMSTWSSKTCINFVEVSSDSTVANRIKITNTGTGSASPIRAGWQTDTAPWPSHLCQFLVPICPKGSLHNRGLHKNSVTWLRFRCISFVGLSEVQPQLVFMPSRQCFREVSENNNLGTNLHLHMKGTQT